MLIPDNNCVLYGFIFPSVHLCEFSVRLRTCKKVCRLYVCMFVWVFLYVCGGVCVWKEAGCQLEGAGVLSRAICQGCEMYRHQKHITLHNFTRESAMNRSALCNNASVVPVVKN